MKNKEILKSFGRTMIAMPLAGASMKTIGDANLGGIGNIAQVGVAMGAVGYSAPKGLFKKSGGKSKW